MARKRVGDKGHHVFSTLHSVGRGGGGGTVEQWPVNSRFLIICTRMVPYLEMFCEVEGDCLGAVLMVHYCMRNWPVYS